MHSVASPILVAILLAVAMPLAAEQLQVTIDTGDREWLARTEAIRITVTQFPTSEEGRLAVLFGETDVTDLFRTSEDGLTYRPDLMPLPAGETPLAVYLVHPDGEWSEIARTDLKVLHRGGFRTTEVTPRLDLESQAMLDEGPVDSGNRSGFRDGTGQFDLRGGFERDAFGFSGEMNVVGVTEGERALRFGERGPQAPKADLSSYRMQFHRGPARLEIGHLSFGQSRHLINSFSSRGAAVTVPVGGRVEVGIGAFNGSSIVGWSNLLGLAESDHQIASARLAFDVLPSRPGMLRLEGTVMDGSVLPLAGFNQGVVNDREESDGWSLSLQGALLDGRLRFGGGHGESTFANPFDPFLADPEDDLVSVERETRNAHYLDLAFDLFRERPLTAELPLTLTVAYRREMVEPLYRTVASFVQADLEQETVELTTLLGPVMAQASVTEMEDNLDDVPSVLKTSTSRRGFVLALPLAPLVEGRAAPWLPVLSYSFDRTHQRGEGVPENSLFAPSHVPDQVSLAHNAGLAWQGDRWSLSYNLGSSDQDNRQPGRENADFTTLVHGIGLGLAVHPRLDLDLDWGLERARNDELLEVARTTRYGLGFQLRPADWTTVTGSISTTESDTEGDLVELSRSGLLRADESTSADLQVAFRFSVPLVAGRQVSPQLFVRYSYQENEARDSIFGFDEAFRSWGINSGINVSFY